MQPRGSATSFERLEADWADLCRAFEARVVDWHRGLPVDDDDYPPRRRAFGGALAAIETDALTDDERAGVACVRSALTEFDEMEPVDDLEREAGGPIESPVIAALRHATYEAYGAAAASIDIGGETIDRLTAFERLTVTDDAAERRATFEAMAPVWQAVDGDGHRTSPYRQLVTASAARWAVEGSVIEANAAVLGVEPGAFEPMLHRILDTGRDVVAAVAGLRGGVRLEPWDYRYVMGASDRRLRGAIGLEHLRPINDAHLRSLGADPSALRIGYDILPRPDRPTIPVAFSIGGRPGPWVFATYHDGGLGNLLELIHESGHALHYAAIRTRPVFAAPPATFNAFFEAVADLIGWDADEPAFQRLHLGVSVEPSAAALARYGPVLLDVCWSLFEIELHDSPGRRPNDVWSEIVADGLGIEPHPEWSWWAVRGQLIDSPGYLANYGLSAITAAALRARIRELRGDWATGDPGWYDFVSERLLRFGGERSPADLIRDLLGEPLTEAPLLADLARAG